MEVTEALKILNISKLTIDSEKEIRNSYIMLMKKYHPDLHVDSSDEYEEIAKKINTAYSLLKERVEALKKMKVANDDALRHNASVPYHTAGLGDIKVNKLVISSEELLRLYKNESIDATGTIENKVITKSSLYSENVYIDFNAVIAVNGVEKNYYDIVPFRRDDNYDIKFEIPVEKIQEQDKIEIRIHDRKLNFTMSSRSLKIKFKFDSNVKATVLIQKAVIKKEDTNKGAGSSNQK